MWLAVCMLIFWIGVGLGLTTIMNRGDFEHDLDDVNFEGVPKRHFKDRLSEAYQNDPFACIEIIAITVVFWPAFVYLLIKNEI